MKLLETGLFALALLAVPTLAWLLGRLLGRRDWPISRVVAAGCMAALVPNVARFALLAALDRPPFLDAAWRQAAQTLESPEVGMFFVTLGVFVTMLAWTATPVMTARARADTSVRQRH